MAKYYISWKEAGDYSDAVYEAKSTLTVHNNLLP